MKHFLYKLAKGLDLNETPELNSHEFLSDKVVKTIEPQARAHIYSLLTAEYHWLAQFRFAYFDDLDCFWPIRCPACQRRLEREEGGALLNPIADTESRYESFKALSDMRPIDRRTYDVASPATIAHEVVTGSILQSFAGVSCTMDSFADNVTHANRRSRSAMHSAGEARTNINIGTISQRAPPGDRQGVDEFVNKMLDVRARQDS